MHVAAPPDKLAAIWSQVEEHFGTYQGIVRVSNHGPNTEVAAAFSHHPATFNAVVNGRGRVVGFHVVGLGD